MPPCVRASRPCGPRFSPPHLCQMRQGRRAQHPLSLIVPSLSNSLHLPHPLSEKYLLTSLRRAKDFLPRLPVYPACVLV
jgi:uncharacterized protein (DUF1810 family)